MELYSIEINRNRKLNREGKALDRRTLKNNLISARIVFQIFLIGRNEIKRILS